MRITTVRGLLLLLPVTVLLAGCVGTPVALRTEPRPVGVDASLGRKITASASGFQLFLFIPIGTNERQAQAHENLVQMAGGDIVTDIKVQESWTYAFVGTIYTTTLEATAYPRQ